MKKVVLLISLLFVICSVQAQDIFQQHGLERETWTLSQGRFEEIFPNKEVVQIGSVLIHTKTNKVVGFLDEGTEVAPFQPEHSSRALQRDPLARMYPHISPYALWANNPLKYTDPTGMYIVISGALSQEALKQLQARAGNSITLTMDAETGNITYATNTDKALRGDAKRLAGMIDNTSITVNLQTTDNKTSSIGGQLVGGAFLGNKVTTDANGKNTVEAFQEINPNTLGAVDEHMGTKGTMIMHEATEAYEGAKMSQKTGVSNRNSNWGDDRSVYDAAHMAATPQHKVYEILYDRNGNVTRDRKEAVRQEFYVEKNGVKKIIQTQP
jgi:hypothetical protein